jgi:hypothetical protein
MADLITSDRAKYGINQASFTSAENTTIAALVTAVSKAVKRYCKREFDSQTFDELYQGSGSDKLILKQYPIVSVARVACDPIPVIRVRNTSSSNQRATVSVTSTGVSLTRVSGGSSSTSTVDFATYTTLTGVVTQINTLGNGWEAALLDSKAQRASSDLRAPQGAFWAADSTWCELKIHTTELSSYRVDADRGWLYFPEDTLRNQLDGYGYGAAWDCSQEYRVVYTAGYSTVPEDVQEACAQWVASLFWQTKDNPAVYPDLPPSPVLFILNHYKRHRV